MRLTFCDFMATSLGLEAQDLIARIYWKTGFIGRDHSSVVAIDIHRLNFNCLAENKLGQVDYGGAAERLPALLLDVRRAIMLRHERPRIIGMVGL